MNLISWIILVWGAVIILSVLCLIIDHKRNKLRRDELRQQRAEFFMKEIDALKIKDIQETLEMLIVDCFDDYLASNPEYYSSTYIIEEVELKITKDIADRVSARMSEGLYRRLTLYYNESSITDLIAEKVYLKVTNFVISINQTKK